MLLDIIIIGFTFYVGYQLGMTLTAYRLRHLILKEIKDQGYDIDKVAGLQEKSIHRLSIEQVNETLYLYNQSKHEFICQANTVEQLAELALKYKDVKYAIVIHNDRVYSFADGKLLEKYEG